MVRTRLACSHADLEADACVSANHVRSTESLLLLRATDAICPIEQVYWDCMNSGRGTVSFAVIDQCSLWLVPVLICDAGDRL